MFEKFRFGSYRIDDSELANLKRSNNNSKSYAVAVEFLDSKKENFYLEVRQQNPGIKQSMIFIILQ